MDNRVMIEEYYKIDDLIHEKIKFLENEILRLSSKLEDVEEENKSLSKCICEIKSVLLLHNGAMFNFNQPKKLSFYSKIK